MSMWYSLVLLLALIAIYLIWDNRTSIIDAGKKLAGGGGVGKGGGTPGKPL